MKTSVFIATSLDGFIARLDGTIDWLGSDAESGSFEGEDYGYKAFFDTVDALVMGRNTFEKVITFEEWPYGPKPVIVLSHQPVPLPGSLAETVEVMSGSPAEVVERLAQRGWEHLYLDGGKTIQGFLKAGLVQEMIITRLPILIGSGLPLFGGTDRDIKLRHVRTQSFADGFVQSHYAVLAT